MYYIGFCKFCGGVLGIEKDNRTGKVFIYCDECMSEWEDPNEALNNEGGTRFQFNDFEDATEEDVKKLNWTVNIMKWEE